jgi:hypothetical protein
MVIDTVYTSMVNICYENIKIYITADCGDIKLGHCFIDGKRRSCGWNYESKFWTLN